MALTAATPAERIPAIGRGWWSCPRCAFRRHYATARGAFEGAGKHLMVAHRVRLVLAA